MISIDHLSKRGRLAYFEIMTYLYEEEDFKTALLTTISEELSKYKRINLIMWMTYNLYFTLSEKQLIGSWVDKYGLLPLEQAMNYIYSKYSAENFLHECGLYREVQEYKKFNK